MKRFREKRQPGMDDSLIPVVFIIETFFRDFRCNFLF